MPASRRCRDSRRPHPRRGLTLLEVMLALAILGGALLVLGELIRIGARGAEDARQLTKAQLLCESKLNELAAGLEPLQPLSGAAFPLEPDWVYSVEVAEVDAQGLLAVRVTVQQVSDNVSPPTFSLMRWMLDPSLELLDEGAVTEEEALGGI